MKIHGVLTYVAPVKEWRSQAGATGKFQSVSVEGFFLNLEEHHINGFKPGDHVQVDVAFQGMRRDPKTGVDRPNFKVLSIVHG